MWSTWIQPALMQIPFLLNGTLFLLSAHKDVRKGHFTKLGALCEWETYKSPLLFFVAMLFSAFHNPILLIINLKQGANEIYWDNHNLSPPLKPMANETVTYFFQNQKQMGRNGILIGKGAGNSIWEERESVCQAIPKPCFVCVATLLPMPNISFAPK